MSLLTSLANKLMEKHSGELIPLFNPLRTVRHAFKKRFDRDCSLSDEDILELMDGHKTLVESGPLQSNTILLNLLRFREDENKIELEVEKIKHSGDFWGFLALKAQELGGIYHGGINRSSYLFPTEEAAKKYEKILAKIGLPGEAYKSGPGWRIDRP